MNVYLDDGDSTVTCGAINTLEYRPSEDFGFVKHKSFAPPSDLQSKFKIENLGHWYLLQDSYVMGDILHLLGVGFYPYQVTVLLCSPSHCEMYDWKFPLCLQWSAASLPSDVFNS
jgi:hypothetical protein